MLLQNVAGQGIYTFAFDTINNVPKTGDAANISGTLSKDGAAPAAFATTHPTEIGGGLYWQPLSQAETNCNSFAGAWTSVTVGIQIDPVIGSTDSGLISAILARALAIPTNPVLTNDGRLNFLDAAISSRASALIAPPWALRMPLPPAPFVPEAEYHVGDVTPIVLQFFQQDGTPLNIANFTQMYFTFLMPDKRTTVQKSPVNLYTDGTDGKAYYQTLATDFVQAGRWRIDGFVKLVGGQWTSASRSFEVAGTLANPGPSGVS